jgi:hypothetical protein
VCTNFSNSSNNHCEVKLTQQVWPSLSLSLGIARNETMKHLLPESRLQSFPFKVYFHYLVSWPILEPESLFICFRYKSILSVGSKSSSIILMQSTVHPVSNQHCPIKCDCGAHIPLHPPNFCYVFRRVLKNCHSFSDRVLARVSRSPSLRLFN